MNKELFLERITRQKCHLENLKERWKTLKYDQKIKTLNTIIEKEDFWQKDPQGNTLKEKTRLKKIEQAIFQIETELSDYAAFLMEEESDIADFKEEIEQALKENKKILQELHESLLLNKKNDIRKCYLEINAGAGGTEAQDWALILLRMYTRYCESKHFSYKIVSLIEGEGGGVKSASLFINEPYAFGILSQESGIHRLVRISPFDSNKRRHTSFAAVNALEEVDDIEVTIDSKELRIDTYRAGGAGGQHVNKTDSAVRITHLPTNIVAQCQNERSQLQNKEQAMKILRSRIYKKKQEERESLSPASEKKKIEWGSQIRSYTLQPYKLVKDHRTNLESPHPEKILDGEIDQFIQEALIQRGEE
jgi:peptide chain release factor 2